MGRPAEVRIVVGIGDEDPRDCHAALAFAAEEAGRRDALVTLVHGLGHDPVAPRAPARLAEQARVARRALKHACRYLSLLSSPAPRCEISLSTRSATEALVEESERAVLVVVQRRVRSTLHRLAAGSTTSRVAAQASCPVAVVRAGQVRSGRPWRGVLVGVDHRGHAATAIAAAFAEASLRGCGLTALHAWEPMPPVAPYYGYVGPSETEMATFRETATRTLAEALAGYAEAYPDVSVRARAVQGSIVDALLAEAPHHDLLVVGRHGFPHIASLGLGVIPRNLITGSDCPVLVTPTYRAMRLEERPLGEPLWRPTPAGPC